MGGIEAGLVVLVILFYVVRTIFRGVRAVVQGLRRAFVRKPQEQAAPAAQSQQVQRERPPGPGPRPRTEAGARRPEAGGPAVTAAATGPQFRAQVARLEAAEEAAEARRPAPGLAEDRAAPAATTRLLDGPDDLLRAVILQEVLAKPLSQRRRPPRPMPPPR